MKRSNGFVHGKAGVRRKCMPAVLLILCLMTGCGKEAPRGSIIENETAESRTGNGTAENGTGDETAESRKGDGTAENGTGDVVEVTLAAEFVPSKYNIATNAADNKVILDCDMTYFGDDAMCMNILAQADALCWIDLLGITITGGNAPVASGANAALNQLERIGRSDIPVYMGTDVPLNGFRDMQEQEKLVGKIEHWGVMYQMDKYVSPENYHNLGSLYERSWGYSKTEPQAQDSVDFMIEQVRKYPGQVTIVCTGPVTNVALACRKDTSFAENTAGIIYMAGAVNTRGGITEHAEFNCFYDAEAFEVCLKSAFPAQTVVPRDIAEKTALNKAVFDLMEAKADTPAAELWLEKQYGLYKRNTAYKVNCTDAAAAAVLLNPDLITEKENRVMAVDADPASPAYGAVTAVPGDGEAGGWAQVSVLLDIDTNAYWDFVTDVLCGTQSEETAYTYEQFTEANGL